LIRDVWRVKDLLKNNKRETKKVYCVFIFKENHFLFQFKVWKCRFKLTFIVERVAGFMEIQSGNGIAPNAGENISERLEVQQGQHRGRSRLQTSPPAGHK